MRNLIILAIGLLLAWPALAPAEVVGHITEVEGRVELLKGGKLPASVAKAQDGVEPGDVLRTKSLSRAQITLLDNTTVTISPEARIAIEEYLFDPVQGKRSAVLQLFQGLAHFVVSKVYQVQEPDFIVKTHTAVMGVRGTDVGIRLTPNETTFLNFQGLVRVANLFPEVGGTWKRAEKTAFAFGNALVDLSSMQGSVVVRGLPPTLPFTLTDQDRQLFDRGMQYGPLGRPAGIGYSGPGSSGLAGNLPDAVSPAVTNRLAQLMSDLAIPPRLAAATTTATATNQSFDFSQSLAPAVSYSAFGLSPTASFISGSFVGSRSVAYPGSFSASFNLAATLSTGNWSFSAGSGSFSLVSNTVQVSGPQGGTLTGTMQATLSASGSATGSFNLIGPVSIAPTGALTFSPGGTFNTSAGSGTITGGSWNQTATH